MSSSELVVRELSPRGSGAVSVIAVEGRGALAELQKRANRALRPGAPLVCVLRDGDEELDEALVLAYDDEHVEVHVHGSPPLVRRVLALFGGETERRASNSIEARAAELLERASSVAAARILLDQAQGALRRELVEISKLDLEPATARLVLLAERGRRARFALEPTRVVVAGPVNAGKSTLFNVLVGARRAIESAEPGTTRDVLAARAFLGEYPIELFDTAGERDLRESDAIERAGRELALAARSEADWILWLAPSGSSIAPPSEPNTSVFLARADEASASERSSAPLAIAPLADPNGAARAVATEFLRRFELEPRVWIPNAAAPFDTQLRCAIAGLSRSASKREIEVAIEGLLLGAAPERDVPVLD